MTKQRDSHSDSGGRGPKRAGGAENESAAARLVGEMTGAGCAVSTSCVAVEDMIRIAIIEWACLELEAGNVWPGGECRSGYGMWDGHRT